MTEGEKRLVVIVLAAGLLTIGFVFLQIVRLTAEPVPATTSVEQMLTLIGVTTEAAQAYVTIQPLRPSDTPTPEPTIVPTELTPSPAATDTPVLAVGVPTTTPTVQPTAVPIYVVQSGDTLYVIAFRFGITVDELKGANGLTDNTIYPGQK